MALGKLKILRSHGRQYIPDLEAVRLPDTFRGLPLLNPETPPEKIAALTALCPTGTICPETLEPDVRSAEKGAFSLDLGRCVFCNECAMRYPEYVRFTSDYRLAGNRREDLIVRPKKQVENSSVPDTESTGNLTAPTAGVPFSEESVRNEIRKVFGDALKLRQVSAGGDNAGEMELNASMNVNFDFSRYGVEFVASPRHADGIVITGPITENMAYPLENCYQAIAAPKLVILVGTDAISGGLFADSPALNRSFLTRFPVDLYVPGNPAHPLTFIDGILTLLGKRKRAHCAL